jgi:enoyl-[acyl-carrier protein] reductase II
VKEAELSCADTNSLRSLLGKGRSKKGMFEGDLDEGELEIGQVSAIIDRIAPATEIVIEIWNEYRHEGKKLAGIFNDVL